MIRVICWLCVFGLVAVTPALADEIYRTTDENGNVVFTDDPPDKDKAEPVELDPVTTVPANEPVESQETSEGAGDPEDAEAPPPTARGVQLVYPADEQTIRHNGGNVPFQVALEPEGAVLPEEYRIAIVLDGEVRAWGSEREIVVSPVNRGPHTVRARLINAGGNTRAESAPVEFHLHRVALGNQGNQANQ